jgi:hypothetical protein
MIPADTYRPEDGRECFVKSGTVVVQSLHLDDGVCEDIRNIGNSVYKQTVLPPINGTNISTEEPRRPEIYIGNEVVAALNLIHG